MKFTKMIITGQLDEKGAEQFASRIALAYVISAVRAALIGAAALIYAIRWW